MVSLTVAINTFSRRSRDYLHQLSEGLKNQKMKEFELLIIADGDEIFVKELQKIFSDARIIKSKGKNLSASRNIALRNSENDVVAFIDDDAFPNESWTATIVESFENPDVVGFGGLTVPYSEEELKIPPELYWVVGCTYRYNRYEKQIVRNPQGCNMAVRRDIALKVNGFDESLGREFDLLLSGEEPELFIRIYKKNQNGKTVYDPAGIVYHNVGPNRNKLKHIVRRAFYEGISKRFIKHKIKGGNIQLETEYKYLSLLIFKSIPRYFFRVIAFRKFRRHLNYIMYIKLSILMVGLGYLISPFYLKKKRKTK